MGFSDLGRKLSKLGQDTKNGVQKVSDSVTISNKISQEKKSLERLFALIGEAVYKANPNMPKAGLEDEWAAVKVAYANIASYTEQLNQVKGLIYCPNCGRPAAAGDKFCAKCGFKLNVRPETTGQKMANDLKEAGQEVGKIAGSAASRTGEAVGGAAAGTQNAFSWLKSKFTKPKKAEEELTAAPPQTIVQEKTGTEESGEAAEDAPFRGNDCENPGTPAVGMETPEKEADMEEAAVVETPAEEEIAAETPAEEEAASETIG